MNIQTENFQQDGGNYYLPCGSPFQNMRPMTPIDDMLFRTFCELGDYKLGEIQYMIQNLLFERERQRQQQQQIYDANRADCHDKVAFESITEKKVKEEELKVDVKEEECKVKVIEKVKVLFNNDVEKDDADNADNADDADDTNDDEEVSNANSRSVSESDSEPDNSEPKPKYEPKSESNKSKSKQGAEKVDTSINTTFIFGKIVSIDKDSKAKVILDDERIGSFPTNFKYYGKIGDKVRVSIKFENKDKRMLILNFINIHFEKDDEVTGIISINDSNVIYINVSGIKMATFPKTFNHTGLRDGMKVSCSIYKTYDYKEKNSNNVVGLAANLTFKTILY
jgi:hypothetical protein